MKFIFLLLQIKVIDLIVCVRHSENYTIQNKTNNKNTDNLLNDTWLDEADWANSNHSTHRSTYYL